MILMGNEHLAQASKSLKTRGRQFVNWCRMRWATRRRSRHSWATPDYRKAVSECPLFRHGSGTLRAVMEAAGLEEIHMQPTDAIDAARRATPNRRARRFIGAGQFFILVGKKP